MLSRPNLLKLVDITFIACPFWISLIRDLNGFLKHIIAYGTNIFVCSFLIKKDFSYVTISGLIVSLHGLSWYYTKKKKKRKQCYYYHKRIKLMTLASSWVRAPPSKNWTKTSLYSNQEENDLATCRFKTVSFTCYLNRYFLRRY